MPKNIQLSLIIPIYNRPQEAEEILESLSKQTDMDFEVVIVEDGSTQRCEEVVNKYSGKIALKYFYKENTGPGDSRNFGCRMASGNYFVILDSDCIVPPHYINTVKKNLSANYADAWGGPDKAHQSFTNLQKGINFSMTSLFTTGGIRGGSEKIGKFQPRSFNMGISREVFEKTGGFGRVHPGEDPDLTFRIWKAGFKTTLFSNAYVYHKRRIDWSKFARQMYKFGVTRVMLNKWHPGTGKITYWFPMAFSSAFIISLITLPLTPWPITLFAIYFFVLFFDALILNRSLWVALYALVAVNVQFFSYGWGFLKAQIRINLLRKSPEKAFPSFFFKVN
ncbi:MAG: glycosyltransferase [Bacteroidales bacterium]|nr:glycosyltransferase [Bacteroidales bacterium]